MPLSPKHTRHWFQFSLGTMFLVVTVLALTTYCVFSRPAVLLRIVEEAWRNGWMDVGEVVIAQDGAFRRITYGMNGVISEVGEGTLTPLQIESLREDISAGDGIAIVEGVPTYRFGIENHHIRHPLGIGQLLNVVERNASGGVAR